MLDLRSKFALKLIANECNDGSYKIIEFEEISSALPNKLKADKESVKQIIKHLENGDYISVKYTDDEQICVCPLPFGRQFIESDDFQSKEKLAIKKASKRNSLLVFVFAFLGAFLGALIVNLFL